MDTKVNPARFGIGKPVRRKEDVRLLTGKGRYSDDQALPHQAYASILRSPHAHARIVSIDTAEALRVPGVIAVFTGADVKADSLKPIMPDYFFMGPIEVQRQMPDVVLVNKDGSNIYESPYHLLAQDRARFVGQAIAMVVADTVGAAKDGAEAINVEYEMLPAVTSTREAVRPDAPKLWEHAPSNVCLDAEVGDAKATEAAFARAAHVVTFETWISRVTGVPMEPRTCLGYYDKATGRYTLYAGSGGSNRMKRESADILGVEQDAVRVLAQLRTRSIPSSCSRYGRPRRSGGRSSGRASAVRRSSVTTRDATSS
jgi:aerobic carbon-monoxide dehydrogenase large subunit